MSKKTNKKAANYQIEHDKSQIQNRSLILPNFTRFLERLLCVRSSFKFTEVYLSATTYL